MLFMLSQTQTIRHPCDGYLALLLLQSNMKTAARHCITLHHRLRSTSLSCCGAVKDSPQMFSRVSRTGSVNRKLTAVSVREHRHIEGGSDTNDCPSETIRLVQQMSSRFEEALPFSFSSSAHQTHHHGMAINPINFINVILMCGADVQTTAPHLRCSLPCSLHGLWAFREDRTCIKYPRTIPPDPSSLQS